MLKNIWSAAIRPLLLYLTRSGEMSKRGREQKKKGEFCTSSFFFLLLLAGLQLFIFVTKLPQLHVAKSVTLSVKPLLLREGKLVGKMPNFWVCNEVSTSWIWTLESLALDSRARPQKACGHAFQRYSWITTMYLTNVSKNSSDFMILIFISKRHFLIFFDFFSQKKSQKDPPKNFKFFFFFFDLCWKIP